jgi:hypothetical protein
MGLPIDVPVTAFYPAYETWSFIPRTIEGGKPTPVIADDAGGLPIEEIIPGEVAVVRTFDEMGRLLWKHLPGARIE